MTNLTNLVDAINDAHQIAEETVEEVQETVDSLDRDFEALDEAAVLIYGLDDDLFVSKEEVHSAIVNARSAVEGKKDDAEYLLDELECLLTDLDDMVGTVDYL